jgi:uncharacterized protein YjiK
MTKSPSFAAKSKLAALTLAAASICGSVQAQTSINLGNYSVAATYSLDVFNGAGGGLSGLEGSAITYARDRGTLFFVGDEGTGVIEISLTGQTLSSMTFSGGTNLGWPTTSTNRDAEGLTYLGGGVLVVAEERLQDAFRFNYVAGGTVNLADADFVSIGGSAGNNGLEGISYDPRGAGSFVSIKQQSPQDILAGALTFATGAGGTSSMTQLFNPALLNVTTLSDIQTLSPIDALTGTAAADNLLVLSLGSKRLLEVNRSGSILSSLDLTNILPNNAIEGVTVDENGTIYLIAEQDQTGTAPAGAPTKLIVLVPEPTSAALVFGGLALLGAARRRRNR